MAGEGASINWLLKSDIALESKIGTFRICSSEKHPCLTAAQVVKQGRIPDETLWSQDPQSHQKNRGAWASRDPKHWCGEIGYGQWAWEAALNSVYHKPWAIPCSSCGDPAKDRDEGTLHLPLGGAEPVHAWSGHTLHTMALQRAQISDRLTFPRRIGVGVHHRSLQSLPYTEVKTVYPWGFTEEGIVIFNFWGWRLRYSHFYFDHLERLWKPLGNKSHMQQPDIAYTEPPG